MRARHSSDRALEALRALGGSATLAQVARRADLEREAARRALNALALSKVVEAEAWGTRALREGADNADRVWRLP